VEIDNPPPLKFEWKKGQPPLRPASWFYGLFVEWRERFKTFSDEDTKTALAGKMFATVYREPDTGLIRPGIAISTTQRRLDEAIANARRAMITPRSTYGLCQVRELMQVVLTLDKEYPGWHMDANQIPDDQWYRYYAFTNGFDITSGLEDT
jgi:hypothetical protein